MRLRAPARWALGWPRCTRQRHAGGRFEALAAHRPDDRGSALELLPERASCRQLLAYVGFVAALLCLLQAVFFLLDEQGPIMGL
ncbi:MAG: hypothetical protein R3B68_13975 [Phycisphaerales bacterium]